MKKLILIPFTLIAFLTSCNFEQVVGNGNTVTKSITVDEFDKIKSSGSFNVNLVKGTEGDIEISSIEENLIDHLDIEVVNKSLKLQWKKGTSIKSNTDILITVPFKDINEISLLGSGSINCRDTIKTPILTTKLSGSGNINLITETNEVKSSLTGSGDITLHGWTFVLISKITGSGNFLAYNLSSNQANAKITGSGDMELLVAEKLNAKITGSGDITYKQDTTRFKRMMLISLSKMGSGTMTKVN